MRAIAILMTFTAGVFAATDGSIFDSDSEFMKGFETGILMRSKGGELSEYGCVLPEDSLGKGAVFDTIQTALSTVSALLPDEEALQEAFDMVNIFVEQLQYFILVINPATADFLDLYCRGMIFGLQGSTMLVKIANNLINKDYEASAVDTKAGAKKRSKKTKGGQFDALKSIGKIAKDLGEGFINS